MSNKIPIDDLFREKLSGGKERLNLGAWANMERMLNGQNPYAAWANMERMLKGQNPYATEEEPKRKKRIFPFFIIFVLLSAVVSAGFFWLNKQDNISGDPSHPNTITVVPNHSKSELQPGSDSPDKTNRLTPNQINLTSGAKSVKNAQKQNPVKKAERKSLNAASDEAIATYDRHKASKTRKIAVDVVGSGEPAEETVVASTKSDIANSAGKSFATNKSKKQSLAKDQMDAAIANAGKIEKGSGELPQVKIQKVNTTVAEERISRNRDGSIRKISYDTTDKSSFEIEKKMVAMETIVENTPKDKNYKYHPRYLGAEVIADEQPMVLNAFLGNPAATELETLQLETASDEKEKKRKDEKISVLGAVGAFSAATLAKIAESGGNFFRMFSLLDPGISLGVNAALFNTKHNYGGFHGGLTNHTAISETFSVISELKFFIRNNSGFTINDIQTQIKNQFADTTVLPGYTKYTYQVDSSTRRYNFKSFMSLELPVMLNARFNNFSVYGGPNFVYNMKLKITEINRNYAPDPSVKNEVTVLNGTPFNYPEEKSLQYARNDFGARFGIGYAVGVSYNFNPKIYLDLRLSKVMWDNTKTNTQREISNGVTKVPFTQLSLGYKFKNK